jgi:hypothetical protein
MNKLTLLTYTHSKCVDLHEAYFGRIERFFPELKHNYITSNQHVDYGTCLVYDDNTSHSSQMLNILERITTDYVIYSQEDYVLFDKVKIGELEKAIKVLDTDPTIGFIRLIHSGLGTDSKRDYNADYSYIDKSSAYYYSTQVTVWRKTIMQQMFELSKVRSIFNEPDNSPFLRQLDISGLYEKKHGDQVGGHFNSYTYPYIATAKVKGEWNMQEYSNKLQTLFNEYSIT